MNISKETIILSDIVNYSLKGMMSALGKGNDLTKFVKSISFKVHKGLKISDLVDHILSLEVIDNGDIIVLPSKVIAILENRFVYGLTMENYKQCINNLNFARENLKTDDNDIISEKDMVGLDKINPDKKIGVRYPKNPNLSCYKIAEMIKNKSDIKIDIVISDSDSGGKKGIKLIGCPTIMVTPIGATKGLRLFYCMRVAAAAELTWNNVENTPIVLIPQKKYQTYKEREYIGEFRYDGFINASKENDIISIKNDKNI